MNVSFLRVLAVPALPVRAVDGLMAAWEPFGRVAPRLDDADLNCSVVNLVLAKPDLEAALTAACQTLKETTPERLFCFEAQGEGEADPSEESRLGKRVAELLDSPVYVTRRTVAASAWTQMRPMAFGVDGFALRGSAPTHERPTSRCRGVSLEFGAPTIVVKASLHGVPASALRRMCDAVGTTRGGLAHVGAYPAISVTTGDPLLVLECSDPVKSPLHRALEIVNIEAARYGGSLSSTALLSHVPLRTLLDTLGTRMPLDATPAQIIETHLGKPAS